MSHDNDTEDSSYTDELREIQKAKNKAKRKRKVEMWLAPPTRRGLSSKVCRALRKEARYHPSMPRAYQRDNRGMITLKDSDPRTLYRELKQELR